MSSEVELLDKKRMRYLEWYLVGFLLFVILSVTRFFFRQGGLNSQPVGKAVFVGLMLSLLILIFSALGSAKLGRKMKEDPSLKEALDNELVQSLEVQSWKAAFWGAIGANLFFTLTWFFYPVCDPVMVVLTSFIAGIGAYQATFYFKYRSS